MKTGLRIDTKAILKRLNRVEKIRADLFRKPLMEFTRKTLNSCVTLTPERDAGMIRSAQRIQYRHRVNYIPNYHALEDPTLIVNENEEHWLFSGGRWWPASFRELPDGPAQAYAALIQERNRRMQTGEAEFIAHRIQARSLYKKSWVQCGESIGVTVRAPGRAIESTSRRQPPKAPAKGYCQIRGGNKVMSIVVFNPFLSEPTAYWDGGVKIILEAAMSMHRSSFNAEVKEIFYQFIKDVVRT